MIRARYHVNCAVECCAVEIGRHLHGQRWCVSCAVECCAVEIGRGKIFCLDHYLSLPKTLRDNLWAAWRAAMRGRDGTVTVARQGALNSDYQAAFQDCMDYLRTAPTTPVSARSTVAIDGGQAVTFVEGRRL